MFLLSSFFLSMVRFAVLLRETAAIGECLSNAGNALSAVIFI